MRTFEFTAKRLILVLAAACLAGCGGALFPGGPGGGGNPGGGNPGGGNPGGGNLGGGGIADSRAALLDSIQAKFATFDGSNQNSENQQMLAFMQTKPEFTGVDLDDSGAVSGNFADGTSLVICNNLVIPAASRRVRVTPKPAPTRSRSIPASNSVILANSVGPRYKDANDQIFQMFAPMFYQRIEPDSTVDALKGLSDIAVLYLNAHGAIRRDSNRGSHYCVWTTTVRARDGTTDAKYSADLNDGSLILFMAHSLSDNPVDPTKVVKKVETHYAITAKFVKKYWTGKFTKNSLVFINARVSGSLTANDFRLACLQAGASAYLGWSNKVQADDAPLTAAYLFDRLLGTNQIEFDRESPPQRAFSYLPVIAEMKTHKRPNPGATTNYGESFNPNTGETATLEFLSLNFAFQQLAPSIENLSVDEQKEELVVNGTFGSDKGIVKLGSVELDIKSWTPNQITCALPQTASGDVQVQVYGAQSSNVVRLTEWNGTVKCTFETKGTLMMVMNFKLHFRADMHEERIQPHETPFRLGSNYLNALDTSGTFAVSGSYTSPDGLTHEDWSGSGEIPAFIRPPDGTSPPEVTSVVIQGSFDKDRKWSMAIRAVAKKGNRIHTVIRDTQGKVVSDKTEDTDVPWLSLDDLNGNLTLATASTGFDIPGGAKTHVINADESLTLEWSAMAAKNPPAADAARSAKIRSVR